VTDLKRIREPAVDHVAALRVAEGHFFTELNTVSDEDLHPMSVR
jgi:hypothetical protein